MVEDELELSNDTNVAGSHSGVQVGRGKGFAGGVAFERIVEIYGKADPPPSLLEEVDGLGGAPAKGRNRGDEIALFVLLNQYGEFSFGLHTSTLLQEILA